MTGPVLKRIAMSVLKVSQKADKVHEIKCIHMMQILLYESCKSIADTYSLLLTFT